MEYLQERVKRIQVEKGQQVKEVTLTLDVRTRWNSIISMLDNVFKVKDALKASAEMFQDLPLPSDEDFLSLGDLVAALRPVEILTLKLCEANFNVLKVFLFIKY
jgi:hypothetical protein